MNDDPEYWEKLLASEGMPAEPQRKYIREPVADEEGARPWRGPREVPAIAVDERRQKPPRPDTLIGQLMAEPHTPEERALDELMVLRTILLDVMEELLTPAENELLTAAHLSDETFTAAAKRLGMPYATAWYACDRARIKLRAALEDHPVIQGYLQP